MKKSAEKKNTFDTAIKTIKYFFPIACKAHKGFFLLWYFRYNYNRPYSFYRYYDFTDDYRRAYGRT